MAANLSCLECLIAAFRSIPAFFAKVEPAVAILECPELKRTQLAQANLQVLATTYEKLNLVHCTFEDEVSSRDFCGGALQDLRIYSPTSFLMIDGMEELSKLQSLRKLELIRADFVNDETKLCYAAIGKMKQLTYLNLDRTITHEKAPGDYFYKRVGDREIRQVSELDPSVMEALASLLQHGNLKTMSLQWCTALSQENIDHLRTVCPDCNIIWAPSNTKAKASDDHHED